MLIYGKGPSILTKEEQTSDALDYQNISEPRADCLDAIKTGRRPVCDIEEAHRSTNMSLQGMLSYKIRRSIRWGGERELTVSGPEANNLLRGEHRKPWVYPGA
jgi:hypothetical protein